MEITINGNNDNTINGNNASDFFFVPNYGHFRDYPMLDLTYRVSAVLVVVS